MKRLGIVLAALGCMLCAVNSFAAPSSLSKPEVIKGKKNDIYRYTLKNGIPVYFIENTENSIDQVSIVVKGGRANLKPEQSGLENALFSMMSKSSSKYGYEKRLQMTYEKSSAIFHEESNACSTLSVECINRYMDEMLSMLIDSFMHPAFTKPVYDVMMTEFAQNIQQVMNQPWLLLQNTIDDVAYKGTSYEARCEPTAETLGNITIEAMKDWHKKVLDSRKIMVFAITSMDPAAFIKKLDSSLGTIKAGSSELFDRSTLTLPSVSGSPVVLTHPASAGSGYAVRIFNTPSISDADFAAANLASSIYSKTEYNVVRTKYGSCYTPGSVSMSSELGLGFEYLYMISNMTEFARFMKEARDIMASGKYVDKLNENGSYEFSTIENVLEGAKNSMINTIYASTTKTSGRLGLYVSALVNFGDITAYETMVDRIHAVTASDILRVFKKYWVDQSGRWIAVVGPEFESVISFEE